jgi:hypothetical protein
MRWEWKLLDGIVQIQGGRKKLPCDVKKITQFWRPVAMLWKTSRRKAGGFVS